jgi:hypothetical protein
MPSSEVFGQRHSQSMLSDDHTRCISAPRWYCGVVRHGGGCGVGDRGGVCAVVVGWIRNLFGVACRGYAYARRGSSCTEKEDSGSFGRKELALRLYLYLFDRPKYRRRGQRLGGIAQCYAAGILKQMLRS